MKRIVVMLVGAALMAVMMLTTAMPVFAEGGGGGGSCDTGTPGHGCGAGGGGSDVPDGGVGGNFFYDPNTGEYTVNGGGAQGNADGDGFGIGGHCEGNFTTQEQECVGNWT